MLSIAPSYGQRVCLITLAIVIFVAPNITNTIAYGKSPAFLPTVFQNKSRINVTLSSNAIAGMGTPKAPVKFSVTITNAGNEVVSGMLDWQLNLSLIHI